MRNRRALVYLLVGAFFGLASLVILFIGSLRQSIVVLIAGVIAYMLAVPLIFAAKTAKLDDRIASIEEYLRELACRKPAGRYLDEEEPDETTPD